MVLKSLINYNKVYETKYGEPGSKSIHWIYL